MQKLLRQVKVSLRLLGDDVIRSRIMLSVLANHFIVQEHNSNVLLVLTLQICSNGHLVVDPDTLIGKACPKRGKSF
jgi:hypothetical protein